MKIHKDSHLDHNLTDAQKEYLLARFADRSAFFIESVELPRELGTVPCGLHGPLVGDPPVSDAECVRAPRGARSYPSRLCDRPARPSRIVTVIAGPHAGEPCVVFTMFGGPLAPQEPGELRAAPTPDEAKIAASEAFWREHALSR